MSPYFIDGNEAIARAAVEAGCTFFAGYPITPATTIFNHMLKLLPPAGGICLQGEDEIASIGFCLGASMAGRKVMTATSGPGLSLMSEHISFAIGSEIPIVIVNVQRLGPSTGSATKGADGDIQFMRWGNSGGLPVIVLAPVDAGDCYRLTHEAFNLAEQYRCPVFIASNKEIGLTRESVDLGSLELGEKIERKCAPPFQDYLPFHTADNEMVPDFMPIGGDALVRQTSSSHGPDGYLTVDRQLINNSMDRLLAKLRDGGASLSLHELDDESGAQRLIITYGVTGRAAKEAVERLRAKGVAVSLLVLKTLYPVPEELLRNIIAWFRLVIVIEMNTGQYVREIERIAGNVPVLNYGCMDGVLISPESIVQVVGDEDLAQ